MERFVIGTGRCGSTLMTNMLSVHPECLVASEFLGALDRTVAFESGSFSAAQVVELFGANQPIIEYAMHRGRIGEELLLEAGDRSNMVVPAVMLAAMPALSTEPEHLFGELIDFIGTLPTQSLAQHYLQIMNWLAQRMGKKFWIERSGSSIEYLPDMIAFYPNAKYLHVHRSGIDAATSMRNHWYFQVLVSFFFDPPTRAELEQTEIAGKRVTVDDPVSQRIGAKLPSLAKFAEYWSHQLEIGYSAITRMDKSQYMEVYFEDLIAKPRDTIVRIAEFFEMPDSPGWEDRAAALVQPGMVRSSGRSIPAAERDEVERACSSGQILLGRERSPGIYKTLELIKDIVKAHS